MEVNVIIHPALVRILADAIRVASICGTATVLDTVLNYIHAALKVPNNFSVAVHTTLTEMVRSGTDYVALADEEVVKAFTSHLAVVIVAP